MSRSGSMSSADITRVHDRHNGINASREGSSREKKIKKTTENLQMKPTVEVIDENKEMRARKDSRYGSDLTLSTTARVEYRSGMSRKDSRYESNNSLSNTSQKRTHIATQGIVNAGYTGSVTGSASNLTVVREQYCSCTRWSKLEKILVISVTVLGIMVLALVVTVGILAEAKSGDTNSWWVF